MSNNDLQWTTLIQIIAETFGDNFDDITGCVITHVIYNHVVSFSEASPVDGPDRGGLLLTWRAACEVIANVKGQLEEMDYLIWFYKHSEIIGDYYEVPPEYQELKFSIIDKLSRHPWVDGIASTTY